MRDGWITDLKQTAKLLLLHELSSPRSPAISDPPPLGSPTARPAPAPSTPPSSSPYMWLTTAAFRSHRGQSARQDLPWREALQTNTADLRAAVEALGDLSQLYELNLSAMPRLGSVPLDLCAFMREVFARVSVENIMTLNLSCA